VRVRGAWRLAKIVIENRVCVQFLQEIVGSVVERWRWEAAVCDNKFDRAKHIE